jgi:hypothetical protein
MKKISRQSTTSSSPPSTGPAEEATAPPMAHIPSARARGRGSGKASRSSAIAEGIITAAAEPCTSRAATRASPHAAEATTNTTSPSPKAGRAPIRSLSDPADSSSAASISV